jgi:putative amino-acid transport system ATP-binding protein
MITLESVSKQFGQQPVFTNVDLHLEQGEIIVIIGPSGTGKSTLLRCINFLERPEAGCITVGDLRVDARKASRADILALRRRTAFVFQNYACSPTKRRLRTLAKA